LPRDVLVIISATLLIIIVGFSPFFSNTHASPVTNNKVVIINFDDGRKTQFIHAKPILDKYGFKATFYIVCNYVDNKKGFMTWDEIETLNKEGHDIGSHSMNHVHLSNLSKKHIEYEVGQSKKCLEDHGIEATSFAYPFNDGSNVKKVFELVSKYYDLARIGNNPLTYLSCDGLKVPSVERDCKTYTNTHYITYANKFTISGWSQDFSRMVNSYNDAGLFKRFINVVNSQDKYNVDGLINAIPIIIYHRIGEPDAVGYNTEIELFKREMKYLHDNGFTVLTMADLAYDDKANHIYIKQFDEQGVSRKIVSVNEDSPSQVQTFSGH
jgi:peptidoglycan/xylan/chitin deacetylase (PgdA/CDA1 family)